MKIKLKIAILGTKGVPNNYGGFEQFAEFFSKYLYSKGYDVTVYNPSYHPYNEKVFDGVKIRKVFCPEKYLGGFAHIIYDFLCLKDALSKKYDIILELGYQSVAPSYLLLPFQSSVVITNMDGLEWKRSKWNFFAKKYIKFAEKVALMKSNEIISDNDGIAKYFSDNYGINSKMIPYGADIFLNPEKSILNHYNLKKDDYCLAISRIEPENNLQIIIEGFINSKSKLNLIIIGDFNNKYGKFLINKYNYDQRIKFLGSVYNLNILNNLRFFSKVYFHGHSVGGTNPSLLEAMAANAFVCAHDNIFNRNVLNDNAEFFSNSKDISFLLDNIDNYNLSSEKYRKSNIERIKNNYNWEIINESYLKFILKVIN